MALRAERADAIEDQPKVATAQMNRGAQPLVVRGIAHSLHRSEFCGNVLDPDVVDPFGYRPPSTKVSPGSRPRREDQILLPTVGAATSTIAADSGVLLKSPSRTRAPVSDSA